LHVQNICENGKESETKPKKVIQLGLSIFGESIRTMNMYSEHLEILTSSNQLSMDGILKLFVPFFNSFYYIL